MMIDQQNSGHSHDGFMAGRIKLGMIPKSEIIVQNPIGELSLLANS
jgi:hypothetical protein